MKIAVIGGTGTVGSLVTEEVSRRGHQRVIISRSTGVDVVTGTELTEALTGCEVLIDVSNHFAMSSKAAVSTHHQAAQNVVRAAEQAGVGHMVLLSIVGVDRNPHQYYAGKLAQEQVYEEATTPQTILRATQFHEFASQSLQQAKLGPLRIVPKAHIQPVAAAEVAQRLVEIADAAPVGRADDLAGPRAEQLGEMARRYARKTGLGGVVVPVGVPLPMLRGLRKGLNLPGEGAQLGQMTFSEWLEQQS